MKTDRLIGIVTTIQQKGTVTAPYLAEKFGVSRRTINRDIEDICKAGIPLLTKQGAGGGISIMEGFSLDAAVLTRQELSAVLTGLRSLDSVSKAPASDLLAAKLGADTDIPRDMEIDLASFYKNDLAEKIETIRRAVKETRRIVFHYYYAKGEADKLVEPYRVVFRWGDWYVFGFCPAREDFRLYKLRRLWNLNVTDEFFTPREVPPEKEPNRSRTESMTDDYIVTAVYEPAVKYRLVEEYGPASFITREDGKLYTEWGFSTPEDALRWLLSFGVDVQVTAPPEMVKKMRSAIKKMKKRYKTGHPAVIFCVLRSEYHNLGGTHMIDSRCGLHCTTCTYKEPCGCGGCIETNGHPFHGACPVAQCCQEKGFYHCGECPELPCELLWSYTCDPEQGDTPHGARVEQCRIWRAETKGKP